MAEPCLHQHFDARVDVTRILPDGTSDPETARPFEFLGHVEAPPEDAEDLYGGRDWTPRTAKKEGGGR